MNNKPLFDGDDKLFKLYLKNCKLYFEYGVGMSTRWVLENSNSQIIAVDTDKEWIDFVNMEVDSDRANLIWVNLGDLTKWEGLILINVENILLIIFVVFGTLKGKPMLY